MADSDSNISSLRRAEVRLVLVHGTILFARFSWLRRVPLLKRLLSPPSWIRAHSTFLKYLRERALQKGLVIERIDRVCWSGGNSFKDRRTAVDRLRASVKRSAQDGKHTFVIAHSHGGNVAYDAMEMMSVSQKIKGLVCLGTPFFRYAYRDWTLPLLMICLAICVPLSVKLMNTGGFDLVPDNAAILFAFSVLVIGGVVVAPMILLVRRLGPVEQRAAELLGRLTRPRGSTTALLCIESGIQEARWALGFGPFLRRLPFFIAGAWILWLCYMYFFMVTGLVPSTDRMEPVTDPAVLWFETEYGLPVVMALAALVSTYITNKVFIGSSSLLESLFIDTQIDFTPAAARGDYRVIALPNKRFGGLEHCRIHDEEAVVHEVVDWIHATATSATKSQSRGAQPFSNPKVWETL